MISLDHTSNLENLFENIKISNEKKNIKRPVAYEVDTNFI